MRVQHAQRVQICHEFKIRSKAVPYAARDSNTKNLLTSNVRPCFLFGSLTEYIFLGLTFMRYLHIVLQEQCKVWPCLSVCLFLCLFLRMLQVGNRWTDFDEISYERYAIIRDPNSSFVISYNQQKHYGESLCATRVIYSSSHNFLLKYIQEVDKIMRTQRN